MKSLWNDTDAEKMVAHYAVQDVNRDVAQRVYTSRLLGGDPALVMHGGGNTSVKTTMTDAFGDEVDVLCVKGSGWDLGDIEPAGLPAVRLRQLRWLVTLDTLSTKIWSTCNAAICSTRRRPTRRSRPCCMPSCRTSSSTIPIRPRCWRSATSPMGRPFAPKSMAAVLRSCPTSCRASRWPRKRRKCRPRRLMPRA